MKNFFIPLLIASLALPIEGCQKNKHACGTKHQKRVRHKKIKRNTNFMTY